MTTSSQARNRRIARRIAQVAVERDQPLAWFEELYGLAKSSGLEVIPWADLKPNPHLVRWLDRERFQGEGKRSLVVGCGLGDDAEELVRRGFKVTAIDVSQSAIEMATTRFGASDVEYKVADILRTPATWSGAFDFVHEAYTLQVLPCELRTAAAASIASLVAPGGYLLLISRARDDAASLGEVPWPVSRAELSPIEGSGLELVGFEDFLDDESPAVRRFRATYRRPR